MSRSLGMHARGNGGARCPYGESGIGIAGIRVNPWSIATWRFEATHGWAVSSTL
jgi:hypothetical protein